MIHIEGMGWFGSMTALMLDRAGVDFTWSETYARHVAWPASTGIVYPAGDARSEENRENWVRWVLGENYWLPTGTAKLVPYVFAHKRPPHGGRYEVAEWEGLRMASALAVAVHPARIVHHARARFAGRGVERTSTPSQARVIVAHAGERLSGYVWGWSRKVKLSGYPHAIYPAFYGRAHRFDITYAYPVPDESGWWWAGSALVNEKYPRQRNDDELEAYWRRWETSAAKLFPKMVVEQAQPIVQGWRPRPAAEDDGQLRVTPDRVQFPALWHSGVRWAPKLIESAVAWAIGAR